jgi:hypothetical protein
VRKEPSRRDPRIDFLRGIALLTIFVDHVPGNTLGMLTLRNFGFADAAELFVILSGFSSMAAYGHCFHRDGARTGLRQIAMRCLRLYAFQVGLLIATFAIVKTWGSRYGFSLPDLMPFVSSGMTGIKRGLELAALPPAVDILPLYIVFLGFFPLIYLCARISPTLVLIASGALWVAANLDPSLNLTNSIDGRGWFFNPFAWQFLFVIGALGHTMMGYFGNSLPGKRWLIWVCGGYLIFALLASAPWSTWGWSDFRPLVVVPTDKTNLAPLRLLDILALVYLALSSSRFGKLASYRWLGGITACGRHSLEVFSLSTLLGLTGRLLFIAFGTTWEMQLAINGVGIGLLLAMAKLCEGAIFRKRAASTLPVPTPR